MDRTFESALMSHQTAVLGTFTPHTYSVGLRNKPAFRGMKRMPYPVDTGDPTSILSFFDHLTALHELTHYAQFVGTNYGLDYARTLNMAYRALLRGSPWPQPLARNGNPDYLKNLSRLIDFFYFYQVDLTSTYIASENLSEKQVGLFSYPHHVQLTANGFGVSNSFVETLQWIDYIRGSVQPVNMFRLDSKSDAVICNTTTLFEGAALITELVQLSSAFPDRFDISKGGLENINDHLSKYPLLYKVCFYAYVHLFDLPLHFFTTNLLALIDIALMYSPITVHGIAPTAGVEDGSQNFVQPFDVFLSACLAAKDVQGIRYFEMTELQRYQDDVCARMGIPSVRDLTKLGLDRLKSLNVHKGTEGEIVRITTERDTHPFNRTSFNLLAHYFGLSDRKENTEGYFYHFSNSVRLLEVFNQYDVHMTTFDILDKSPWNFGFYAHLDSAVIGGMIVAFLRGELKECPLKIGKPFYCMSKGDEFGTYCSTRVRGDIEEDYYICPFYKYGQYLNREKWNF